MTSNPLRSFASGLLVAATIIGAFYLFGPSQAESSEKATKTVKTEKLSEDQMIEQLTSKGFVVHTEDEWNKQMAKANEQKEKKPEKKNDDGVVYRTILNVSMGMTSIDIGNALEEAKIIDDGMKFYKEVENRGLENELRPGTFQIESGMSMDEIISIIFK
ncbi:endolytic transglycosylase MltG [Rossellomorea aquimaris]|uniref:endolytic transglycosylase MltG n=1 Tax=Rossellomorea aquimaris TaxID=189382 RepID=UPI001CD5A863|nr:endolytic transglycosylase MltG [Rossellomorea aquimaris]MCA1055743.1 endolytic transglycosylase MltG [Rossellomorea aquimaris]